MSEEAKVDARPVVLNVNDVEGARYMVTLMLRGAGFEVIEAADGPGALAMVEAHRPEVLVLDVDIPGMDGFEVCRRLRATPPPTPIKILHTSAKYLALENKIVSLETGADGYLMQPFEAEELIATVRSLLRFNAAERALLAQAQDLRDAAKRKDEFLAMLAHELRNPLAAIIATIPNLERRPPADESERRARSVLTRQVDQLGRLVDDLLDAARVTYGKISLRTTPLDLRAVLERAAASARTAALSARRQALVLELPDSPAAIVGDTVRLEQVFANLLDNASKYSEPGTTVTVTLTLDAGGREARVAIVDQGIGMAPETIPGLFGLFAQGEVSLDRTAGGLGIGLTLVQNLVSMHDGKVSARSDGKGQGSTFEVVLPLAGGGALLARGASSSATSDARKRILLVEDGDDLREMLEEVLRSLGHDVVSAADGASAVALAEEHDLDLALVDIGLPGIDGYEVARRIRARGPADGMTLIAMTGYGSAIEKSRARAAGFDDHLTKPVTIQRIVEAVGDASLRDAG